MDTEPPTPPAPRIEPKDGRTMRRALWALLVGGFVWWGAQFILLSSYVAPDGQRYFSLFDDGMISMRYAWNIAHGVGPVWNEGERVEAITNVLMTMFLVPWAWLLDRSAAVLAVQASGIGLMLLVAGLTARVGAQLRGTDGGPRHWSLIEFGAVLACYPLAYWALMGMETALLTAVLLAAVSVAIAPWGRGRSWGLGVLLGLLFWCRPEQGITIGIVLAYRLARARAEGRPLRDVAREAALAAAFIALLTAMRYGYYGRLTPNTYRLKVEGIALGHRLRNGAGFIKLFVSEWWPLMGLGLLHTIVTPRRERVLFYALFASTVLYQVWAGGDPWWLWRIMCPAAPLLLLLCVDEVRRLWGAVLQSEGGRRYLTRDGRATTAGRLSALTVFGLLWWLDGRFLMQMAFLEPAFQINEPYATTSERIATGQILNKITRPTATVGLIWAGTIAYYADRRGVDFLGKADPYIASLRADVSGYIAWCGMYSVPGHNKYDLNYSIGERRPTYVQWFRHGSQDMTHLARALYTQVTIQGISLWLLRDSPDVDWALVRRLQTNPSAEP